MYNRLSKDEPLTVQIVAEELSDLIGPSSTNQAIGSNSVADTDRLVTV